MLHKVTHCAGRVSANTRPHQLRWGDREMGTAISCTKCSQVAGMHGILAHGTKVTNFNFSTYGSHMLNIPTLTHLHTVGSHLSEHAGTKGCLNN